LWNGLRCVHQRTNMASTDIYGESDVCIQAMSKRPKVFPRAEYGGSSSCRARDDRRTG
jgi:hypothetical protein